MLALVRPTYDRRMGPERRILCRAMLVACVVVLLAPGATRAAAPPPDEATWLYQPDQVAKIDLTLPAPSRKALAEDSDEYVRGTFRLTRQNGQTYGPLTIGVKLKGHTSFRSLAGKAAFKLKFGEFVEDQRFQGLKTLVLNNMLQDASMLHEVLAYEAFRAAGLVAWRTGYAFVRVNGQAYGVYLNLESPDDVALKRWYPTTTHLYEGGLGVDTFRGAAPRFGLEEGDEDNLKDLEALIAAVRGWRNVDAVADLAQMTRYWAVEKYIGHWDGYSGRRTPNNFYLHSDAAGRFTMLPWGTDQTWEWRGGYGDPGGLMFNRCLANASCLALYRQAVDEVRATLNALDLPGLASRTAAVLAPWQRKDPRQESSARERQRSVAALQRFLVARRTDTAWRSAAPARVTVRTRVLRGGRVRFSGSVVPRHDGKRVLIQRRGEKRYVTIGEAKLTRASSARSAYAVTLRGLKRGRYRVYLPPDDEHLAATQYVTLTLP